MIEKKKENLEELFARFGDAGQAVSDIEKGERILREYPAPEPEAEVIAKIKARVGEALQQQEKGAWRGTAYKLAAVAAVIAIVAAVSVRVFEPDRITVSEPVAAVMEAGLWDSDDVSADDAVLATYDAELEQIESEFFALRLGENGQSYNGTITELEIEYIEINSDFWKG